MKQAQCPECERFEVHRIAFRKDPATGERVKRPASKVLALLVSVPIGVMSLIALIHFGLGSGCGLWVLGLTAGIAIPVVVWDQHRAYNKLPGGIEFVCASCGKRWESTAEGTVSWVEQVPKIFWRFLRWPPRILYSLGLGPLYGRFVLLLTTTGRKTGLPRTNPLQYEEVNGSIYGGAARGVQADWFRNILANPVVEVRVKSRRFRALAEPITDPCQIADFIELRLKRHPRMIGAMLRLEGLPATPTREQLETYAANRAMVVMRPEADADGDTDA
jgi:deazaflavin-dependent oxidoreductase (nitroreductase family)